ncbi:MAG: stalk domain-containing protein [Peptococcaceae bacterium]
MKKITVFIITLALMALLSPVYAAEPEYSIVPGVKFRVINDEIFTNNNRAIVRNYTVYSGTEGVLDYRGGLYYGKVYEDHDIIDLPQAFKNLTAAKQWLAENAPERLRLPANTIVSEGMFNTWIDEGYNQNNEYWSKAPRYLISQDLKPNDQIIPEPYLPENLNGPAGLQLRLSVNHEEVSFAEDKPYLSETNEIVVPLRSVAQLAGWEVSTYRHGLGQPIIKLVQKERVIELSVWRDYFTIDGIKVKFQTRPRLSINNRVFVPLSFLNFMGIKI